MPERKSKKTKSFVFKNITVQPGDIVIILDTAGRIIEANEAASRTFGLSPNEIIGLPWLTIFPNSALDIRAIIAGRDFANGFDFVRPDGTSVSLYFFATLGIEEDNQPARIVCIGRDVTPFWHSTERFLISEKKYQLVTKLSNDGIIVISTTGKILEANPAAGEIAGLPVDRLIGQSVEQFVSPEERLSFFRFGQKVIRKGSGQTILRIINVQHKEKKLKIVAELLEAPTEQKIYCSCQDVSWEYELREALDRSQLLIDCLFDAEPAALFLETMDGTILRVNRAATHLFGLPHHEIINRRLREIVPIDVAILLPQMRTAILDKKQFQAEIYTRRRDGRALWLLLSSALLETDKENLILTIVRDITEEKQALIDLRENEARLKLLLSQIPVLIWTTDINFVCTSAIGSGGRWFSIPHGNLIGQKITTAFKGGAEIEAYFQRALKGDSVQFEITDQGRTYHIEIEPLKGLEGELLGTIGLAHDVTEYHHIQKQLKETLFHYQTIVDIAPVTIAVYQNYKIVMINRAGAKMLGYDDPAELIGENVIEFVHPDDWPAASKRAKEALELGKSTPPFRERVRRRDGTYIMVEVLNAPLIWQEKPAVLVVAQDLSGQEKLTCQVQEVLTHTRAILENSPHGIVAESEGWIVYANTKFADLFGYELVEVIGKPVAELLPEYERERITNYMLARKTGKAAPNQYQFDGLLKDGTIRRFNISVTTYRINDQVHILAFIDRV